jgi:hypothetical protein
MYVVKTKGMDLKKRESYVAAWQKKRNILIVRE